MSTKKRGLGRGLDALLDTSYQKDEKNELGSDSKLKMNGVAEIPLKNIHPNNDQPRKEFDAEKLAQLVDSIKHQGIIQPITVRKISEDNYELISGERRFRASQIINLENIPAYIREASDAQVLEMALVENIQRQDLNALEIAISYQNLIQACDIKIEELGERVGKKRSTISNYLRLLKLPDQIQIAVRDNLLSMGHARTIINIESEQEQLIVFEEIIKNKLSVRQVEELVKKLKDKSQKSITPKEISLPYKYQQLGNKLKNKFGKDITIKRNSKGHGFISLNFKDDNELDRLIDSLINSEY